MHTRDTDVIQMSESQIRFEYSWQKMRHFGCELLDNFVGRARLAARRLVNTPDLVRSYSILYHSMITDQDSLFLPLGVGWPKWSWFMFFPLHLFCKHATQKLATHGSFMKLLMKIYGCFILIGEDDSQDVSSMLQLILKSITLGKHFQHRIRNQMIWVIITC